MGENTMFYAFQKISKKPLIALLGAVCVVLAPEECSGMAFLRSAIGAFSFAHTAAGRNLSKFGRFGWHKPLFKTAAKQFRPAETFFFKTDGNPITEDEHRILYDIKLRNQFPMCLAYGDGATVPDDEIVAMQEKLDEKLPGVQVMFIPTSMYEHIVCYELDQMPYMSRHKHDDFDDENNRLRQRDRAHYEANTLIVSLLDRGRTGNFNAISRAIERLKKSKTALFQPIMMPEKEAYDRGEFLLFRAVAELEDQPLGNQSLSFGASWSNSIINDPAASPLWWAFKAGYQGYCVPINKKEYAANTNNLRQMFYIPPLTTVENNFAWGQIFHPRTKIMAHLPFNSGNNDQLLKYIDVPFVRRFYENDLSIKAQTPEEAEQIHREIFTYIKKNRILIPQF
jgi:hypothetical protein